jgi:hypothetical protein
MLFKFIAPLVQEGEDDDDMDEEVRPCSSAKKMKPAGNAQQRAVKGCCEVWW